MFNNQLVNITIRKYDSNNIIDVRLYWCSIKKKINEYESEIFGRAISTLEIKEEITLQLKAD